MAYVVEQSDDAISIVDGDIDKLSADFTAVFVALAPFVESGGIIEVSDEEGEEFILTFEDGKIDDSGEAYFL